MNNTEAQKLTISITSYKV